MNTMNKKPSSVSNSPTSGQGSGTESGPRPGLKTNPTFIERGIAVPSIHV